MQLVINDHPMGLYYKDFQQKVVAQYQKYLN